MSKLYLKTTHFILETILFMGMVGDNTILLIYKMYTIYIQYTIIVSAYTILLANLVLFDDKITISSCQ